MKKCEKHRFFNFFLSILKVEEPMEQNMENIVPEIMEPMEEKEDKENTNRPRTTTPTNIMVNKETFLVISLRFRCMLHNLAVCLLLNRTSIIWYLVLRLMNP